MIGQTRIAVPKVHDGVPRVVTSPHSGRVLPVEGVIVVVTPFWLRRRAADDIDLLEVSADLQPKRPPSAPAEPEERAGDRSNEEAPEPEPEEATESSAADAAEKKPRKRGARGDA